MFYIEIAVEWALLHLHHNFFLLQCGVNLFFCIVDVIHSLLMVRGAKMAFLRCVLADT